MKIKQRAGDFRVRELLVDGYLRERGDYRIYRVTKRKLTSPEAAKVLADEAGIEQGEVGLAGWKDRQGITIQHMSVPGGRPVRVQDQELKIETVGFANEAIDGAFSRGNAFELTVRELTRADLNRLRESVPIVREHGSINYFDDQRFGNLTYGQGWIVKDLMRGDAEKALLNLLAAENLRDNERYRRFKRDVADAWGDWRTCREAAGKFGAHHSIFEYLAKNPGDFAGAFDHVATRLKLIHLYAWQSHLWNRAVCDLVRTSVPAGQRVPLECEEGTLVAYAEAPSEALSKRPSFPLPGAGLDDMPRGQDRDLLEEALAQEGLVADQMRIEGIGGFHLKGEERPLLVRPQHLRVRPSTPDDVVRGLHSVRVRFELPRGSYATLLVKRLFARSLDERAKENESRSHGGDHPRGGLRSFGDRQDRRYVRSGDDRRRGHEGGERDDRSRGYRDDRRGGYRGDRSGGQGGGRSSGQRDDRSSGYRGERGRGQRGDRSWDHRDEGNRDRGQRDDRGDRRESPWKGSREGRGEDRSPRGQEGQRPGGGGRWRGSGGDQRKGFGRGYERRNDRDERGNGEKHHGNRDRRRGGGGGFVDRGQRQGRREKERGRSTWSEGGTSPPTHHDRRKDREDKGSWKDE